MTEVTNDQTFTQWLKSVTTKEWALFVTAWPFLLLARWYWQTHVGLWPCVIFWIIALADEPLRLNEMGGRRKWLYGATMVGGLMNAIATLSNGGMMPVLGKEVAKSVWVPLTANSNVPWLCDIYAGWSLGDFFILGGLVALMANWALEKLDVLTLEAVAKNKRMPGLGIG